MSLRRLRPRGQDGSALVTAMMVMLIILPIGLALLSIVDTQARESGIERTRDRAFNLADSALQHAAFGLSRYSWPAAGAYAPTGAGVAHCEDAPYGETLGTTAVASSATARLRPNLNASFDDAAYSGAAWEIMVCDDDSAAASPRVWDEALRGARPNYDANGNGLVWVRSQAQVGGRSRVLASLVTIKEVPAMSSKYGLITGRMNAELSNTAGTLLTSGLLGSLTSTLLGTDPLVAADPSFSTTPPTSGVTAVRCGVLDGCLTGALAAAGSLSLVSTLVTGGKLVQATSPTAMSQSAIAQLRQQAQITQTYVAETAGSSSPTSPPACTIPTGADTGTVVFIEKVGTTGTAGTTGGPGDQYCLLDVSATKAYKALVIGSGRVVLRGNNTITATSSTATVNTFRGFVYALNEQRAALGDAATPTREVVRIDKGAHVFGGVAADGKSAQVGVYPPGLCAVTTAVVLGITITIDGCLTGLLTDITSSLGTYNPAIQSNVAIMNAITVHDAAALVPGTYRDVAGGGI
jgi:Tfp pilus assembly protein PilX